MLPQLVSPPRLVFSLAEEAKLAEEARKAEEAKRAEEARQAEEAKRAEEARQAEEAKRAEEARQAEEAKLAEVEVSVEPACKVAINAADAQQQNNDEICEEPQDSEFDAVHEKDFAGQVAAGASAPLVAEDTDLGGRHGNLL